VCLAVASTYLERPVSIATFHSLTRSGELGVCSIADLLRALREQGFSARAVRYDPTCPPSHRLPMILHVDRYHFLTAIPASDKRAVLVDPPDEPRVVSWDSLAKRWRGEAVVVGRSDAEVRIALSRN
jgi:ABC-type bacteriocin/lantibiotic exporter with double-glycine peptidase domain